MDSFEEEKSNKDLFVQSDGVGLNKSESSTQQQNSSKDSTDCTLTQLSSTLIQHLNDAMVDMKQQNSRNFEKILAVLQQESAKRSAVDQRLHSQLLLQNETMVAMELKLMRLEAKVERREAAIRQQQRQLQQQQRNPTNFHIQQQRTASAFQTIDESSADIPSTTHSGSMSPVEETPPDMAVINSSGASLASGVTAGSFLGEDGDDDGDEDDDEDDDAAADDDNDNRTAADDTIETDPGEPVTREADPTSQHSTPTQGSRPRVAVGGENGRTLDSILLNPMLGEASNLPWSVRATRGQDTDGNSSLATSVTNSTYTSTVVTSTTRGDGSTINVRRIIPDESVDLELTPSRRGRSAAPVTEENTAHEDDGRSRSQSPLTVHSHTSENFSMASASTVGTSIRSTVAVAPRSGFGRRTASTSTLTGSIVPSEYSRPLANRVVSFTTDCANAPTPYAMEAGDSITIPDEELEGEDFSEVADAFATSARVWREDYEARLDALQKRWSSHE